MWRTCLSLAILVSASGAALSAVECPSHLHSQTLGAVSVFDGPPEEMVDLAPEQTGKRDTWSGLDRTGRPAFLICRYKGTREIREFALPAGTKACAGIRTADDSGYKRMRCE
ncbi:STY0301 family protein [Xanthobacter sp. DSM 24535]|uniref:STY0301 family protein n=1 Tax=Roseixanthobacter psychrophilus TaxID=3119917 RepID=UPI00372A9D6C